MHIKGASLLARLIKIFLRVKVINTYHGIISAMIISLRSLYFVIFLKLDETNICLESRDFLQRQVIFLFKKDIIIPNGVSNKKIKEYKNIQSSSLEKVNVISVCRFVPQKNILDIARIAKLLPNIKFTIIGNGPLWNEINSFKQTIS